MSYSIVISGQFKLDRSLEPTQAAYLRKLAATRRMKRSVKALQSLPDPIREAVGLPIGLDGEFFVGSKARMGQDLNHPSVLSDSTPPGKQPGLWCGWVPSKNGKSIVWNGTSDFDAHAWICYLIERFLAPWGYELSGEVSVEGEDDLLIGRIIVRENKVVFEPNSDKFASTDEEGVATCLRDLRSADDKVRLLSAEALPAFVGYTGPKPDLLEAAFSALVACLADPNVKVRRKVAQSLVDLTEYQVAPSVELLKKLRQFANDVDAVIQKQIAKILRRVG